jgi:hypothetical protein
MNLSTLAHSLMEVLVKNVGYEVQLTYILLFSSDLCVQKLSYATCGESGAFD